MDCRVASLLAMTELWELLNVLFHDQARLENDDLFRRHRHFLSGAGVATQAAAALLDLENAEIAQFDGQSLRQILGDLVQRRLHDAHVIEIEGESSRLARRR